MAKTKEHTMSLETVTVEKVDQVGKITLNRPEKLNAINDAMMRDLEAALDQMQQDPDIWVVVIKGAGEAFSVGQDLSGVGTSEVMPPQPRAKAYLGDMFETAMRNCLRWQAIFDFPRWTIAEVHGYCLGAGCDLAMACRMVMAAEDAVFGDPSIRMGLASPNPLWTWRVGLKKTKEMLFTGKYIDGREAERIGLVMKAIPPDKLEEETNLAAESCAKFGTIGGFDGQAGFWAFDRATYDLSGLSAAWRLASNLHTLSAIQRPGRSIIDRGEFDFYEVRDKRGLKAAIEARDAPFRKYFPQPKTPKENK